MRVDGNGNPTVSFDFPRTKFLDSLVHELESDADGHRQLIVVGPRGAGKTDLLARLARAWRSSPASASRTRSRGPVALAQLESISASPEILHRELASLAGAALGTPRGGKPSTSPSASFDRLLESIRRRPVDSLLLFDDVTELRTLSYYPSVERPLEAFLEATTVSGRTVSTSRFGYWMERAFPGLPIRRLPPLSEDELESAGVPDPAGVARATAGIAVHAARLAETMLASAPASASSLPIERALTVELSSGGRIEAECRATLAELLHRARGYGACKSVLHVLAEDEGLKLTEVARRLDRTPGSTRDYLRWLEEVDLIVAREKRFSYVDPLLRVWMRIYGRGRLASEDDVRRAVESYLSVSTGTSAETAPEMEIETETEEPFTLPPLPSEDLVEID